MAFELNTGYASLLERMGKLVQADGIEGWERGDVRRDLLPLAAASRSRAELLPTFNGDGLIGELGRVRGHQLRLEMFKAYYISLRSSTLKV